MAPPGDYEFTTSDPDERERMLAALRGSGAQEVDVLNAQISPIDPNIGNLDLSSRENYVQRQQQDLTRLLGAQRDAEAEALTPSSLGRGDLLATTFTSVLPTLLGAAIAGRKGLYAGAQAGLGGAAIGVKGLEAEGQKDRERAALRAKGFSDDIKATRDSIKQQVEGGFDAREKVDSDNRLAARNEFNANAQTDRLLTGINLRSDRAEGLAAKQAELNKIRDAANIEARGVQALNLEASRFQNDLDKLDREYALKAANLSEAEKLKYENEYKLIQDRLGAKKEEIGLRQTYVQELFAQKADLEKELQSRNFSNQSKVIDQKFGNQMTLQDDQQEFTGGENTLNRGAAIQQNQAKIKSNEAIFGVKSKQDADQFDRTQTFKEQDADAERKSRLLITQLQQSGMSERDAREIANRLTMQENNFNQQDKTLEKTQGFTAEQTKGKFAQEDKTLAQTQQFTAKENAENRASREKIAADQRAALGDRVIAQQGGFATDADIATRQETLRSIGVPEDQIAGLRPGITVQAADRFVSSQRLAKELLSKDLPTDVRNALTSATTSSYKIDNMLVGLRAYTAKNGKSQLGNLTSSALDSFLPLSERRKLAAELGFFATNVGSEMQGKNLNGPELKSIQDYLTSNESLASITNRNKVDMNLLISRIEQLRNQPKVAALSRLRALAANPIRRQQVEDIYQGSKGSLVPLPVGARALQNAARDIVGYELGGKKYRLPGSIFSEELTALLAGEQ